WGRLAFGLGFGRCGGLAFGLWRGGWGRLAFGLGCGRCGRLAFGLRLGGRSRLALGLCLAGCGTALGVSIARLEPALERPQGGIAGDALRRQPMAALEADQRRLGRRTETALGRARR